MQTIHDAAVYLVQSLPKDLLVTVESLEEQIFLVIMQEAEVVLDTNDLTLLEEKQDDMSFVEQYLSHKIPNFHSLLDTIVVSYISRYTTEE